jgi:hypothetical protein
VSVTFLNYNYNISLKINLMCLWLRNLGSSYLHTEMAQCQIPGEIQEDSRMASSKIQDLMGHSLPVPLLVAIVDRVSMVPSVLAQISHVPKAGHSKRPHCMLVSC